MLSLYHHVVLSLGSNCGDRRKNVSEAMMWLEEHMLVESVCSEIYETRPVGHEGDNYLNAVMAGYCSCAIDELDTVCKEYEKGKGRDARSRKLNLVPVDIDVVIADGEILRQRDFKCSFFQKGYKKIAVGMRQMPSCQYLDALK